MNLWRVDVLTKPSPDHPKYWQIESGVLSVFIFAASGQDAHEKTTRVIELLPYEVTSSEYVVDDVTNEEDSIPAGPEACPTADKAQLKAGRNRALEIGLGLYWLALATGTDPITAWPAPAASASS